MLHAYWPCLRSDDRADGAARCSNVETTSSKVSGKDFRSINPRRRPKADGVAEGIEEDEDYANIVCRMVDILGIRDGQGTVQLQEMSVPHSSVKD
jgi:hypothetical protein